MCIRDSLYDTQKAIGLLKRVFEDTLCGSLHLRRVSAPLFVEASSGLNDDLNGVERPVSFDIPAAGREAQVCLLYTSLSGFTPALLHRTFISRQMLLRSNGRPDRVTNTGPAVIPFLFR